MPFRMLIALVVLFAANANGVTIHRSFRGGFPSSVSEARLNSAEKGATLGTRISPRTRVVAYKRIVGKVVRVDDGDTIWVSDASGKHKIRLENIDAPEIGQMYGEEATRFLDDLVGGKEVEVLWVDKDRRGCILGIVYLNHEKGFVEVNLTMVKNGCAWNSSRRDRPLPYAEAESEARKLRRGLWADDAPVNPGKWRKTKGRK